MPSTTTSKKIPYPLTSERVADLPTIARNSVEKIDQLITALETRIQQLENAKPGSLKLVQKFEKTYIDLRPGNITSTERYRFTVPRQNTNYIVYITSEHPSITAIVQERYKTVNDFSVSVTTSSYSVTSAKLTILVFEYVE